ncbi:MAG: translocation/assembly module TamB domain-containing protein, partial [Geminicoccaceae bacterium]
MIGAKATLNGNLVVGLPGQALDGKLALAVPDLQPLAPALGEDLAGALQAAATIGGTVAAPEVELEAEGRDLALRAQEIARIALQASGHDLAEAPAGEVRLDATVSGAEATLAAGYRLEGSTLDVTDLVLIAPETRLEGAFSVDLARTLVDGRLGGRVADLAAFGPLIPVRLAGALELDAKLEPSGEAQTVALTLDANQIAGDFGNLESAGLKATVEDALGAPTIDASLTLSDFRQGEAELARGEVTARGTLQQLALTASVNGNAMQPFDLEARASLTVGEPTQLRLERLSGKVAEQPVRLAKPAKLSLGTTALALEGLDLRLAATRLYGDLALGPKEVSGDLRLERLPLALLGRFGAPELAGTASASLRLKGAADDPQVGLDLRVSELRPPDPRFADLPPAELIGTVRLAEHHLSADLRGQGLTDKPLVAEIALPVVLQLQPFVFQVPKDGRLTGQVNGAAQLARFASLLPEDQRLEGLLTAALTIAGTPAAPEMDGTVELADGRYANGLSGTVLEDLTLRARVSQERVTLERLSATDGGEGEIEGGGSVALDPAGDFPLDLSLRMRNAQLVRRDDATGTLSARLALRGTTRSARLAGEVQVERAEIRIPDGTGPNIPVLNVDEVGLDGRERPAPAPGPATPFTLALDLEIDLPGQVFVRGRGLESEWQGKLRVSGVASAPS